MLVAAMLSKHEKRGMLVRKGLNLQLAAAHATAVKSTHVRSSPSLSSTYAEWLKPYWRKRPKAQCEALFSSLNRAVMFSTSSLSCLAENPPSRGFSRVHWHRCIIKHVALTVACSCMFHIERRAQVIRYVGDEEATGACKLPYRKCSTAAPLGPTPPLMTQVVPLDMEKPWERQEVYGSIWKYMEVYQLTDVNS